MERDGESREVKYSSNFVKEMALSSQKHGLRSPRDDCTRGKHQETEVYSNRSLEQLYYRLVKHRFRKSTKHLQTLSGADIASDHNLLVAEIYSRL
jgi:endonuclease/exonuclease/phosphatase family metal-dependent hydrolase